jgi:hypothetical protein
MGDVLRSAAWACPGSAARETTGAAKVPALLMVGVPPYLPSEPATVPPVGLQPTGGVLVPSERWTVPAARTGVRATDVWAVGTWPADGAIERCTPRRGRVTSAAGGRGAGLLEVSAPPVVGAPVEPWPRTEVGSPVRANVIGGGDDGVSVDD